MWDITFCSNIKCKNLKCDRNQKNYNFVLAGNHPISIGVHGDWGAGKSSILAMIEERANAKKNKTIAVFIIWISCNNNCLNRHHQRRPR